MHINNKRVATGTTRTFVNIAQQQQQQWLWLYQYKKVMNGNVYGTKIYLCMLLWPSQYAFTITQYAHTDTYTQTYIYIYRHLQCNAVCLYIYIYTYVCVCNICYGTWTRLYRERACTGQTKLNRPALIYIYVYLIFLYIHLSLYIYIYIHFGYFFNLLTTCFSDLPSDARGNCYNVCPPTTRFKLTHIYEICIRRSSNNAQMLHS